MKKTGASKGGEISKKVQERTMKLYGNVMRRYEHRSVRRAMGSDERERGK